MKWSMVVAAVLVLCLTALIYVAVTGSRVPVEAARATVTEVTQYVDERGKTRLPQTHLITMPFDGRIEEITLQEGDPVSGGRAVAHVVQSDLTNALDEAQAVVDRLAEAIERNDDTSVELTTRQQAVDFVESMRHAVEAAKTRMTSGQARLDYAETFLARTQRLLQTGANTQDDADRAKLDYVTADVDYNEDVLVWRSMAAIEAATKLLPQMISQYIDRKSLTHDVLEKERAEAQARLRQVQIRAQRGVMASPVDGVVLQRRVSNERQLAAGEVLLEIGRLDDLEVETDILSQDVVDVQPGDPVEIYGPAIGARVGSGVRGTVDRIYPAGFTKVSSLGVEQQRVKVIIRFDEGCLDRLRAARELGVDYRVRVRIFTERQERAVAVPRSALFRGADGDWQLFAVRGGRARLVPVTIGLMNDRLAEVTSGLSEGELVILAPETNLVDGTRVKPLVRH